MAREIKRAPRQNIINLSSPAPVANSPLRYRVTFGLPAGALNSDSEERVTVVDVWWDLNLFTSPNGKGKQMLPKPRAKQMITNPSTGMSQELDLAGVITSDPRRTFNRNSYYPYKDSVTNTVWYLHSVDVWVHTRNPKGAYIPQKKGENTWAHVARTLEAPREPTVSQLVQDADTGIVSCAITRGDRTGLKEAVDVSAHIEAFNFVADQTGKKTETRVYESAQVVPESVVVAYDVSNRMQLAHDEYVRVTITAKNRGVFSDSNSVTKSLYVSWPEKPTISATTFSSVQQDGKITVSFDKNSNEKHPVTGVRLQKIVNVDYENSIDIPGDEWTDVDIEDNGTCKALTIPVSEVMPETGKYSWVRVKQWNQIERIFSRFSEPVRLVPLERKLPTAADDSIAIVGTPLSGDDGKSAILMLGWDPNGTDDATGTELTWSDNPNSWRSTENPKQYRFSWHEGPIQGTSWRKSAQMHVMGLTEGTKYWFRARRYFVDADGNETYGPYYPDTGEVTCIPTTSPSAVVLSVPDYVARGKSLEVSWSYDSESTQTSWEIITGTPSGDGITDEKVFARGNDSLGSYTIDADRFASLVGSDGSARLAVRVSTGGDMRQSEFVDVAIADAPEFSIDASDVTVQPVTIDMTSSSPSVTVIMVVTSDGSVGDGPNGYEYQAIGDTVWSDAFTPQWTSDGSAYTSTVSLPNGSNFKDFASYTVTARAVDNWTGLSSQTVTDTFSVEWARKAPEPAEGSIVTTHDEVDDNGRRKRYATLEIAAPDGSVESDVVDVYRVTPDGTMLIANGIPTDCVVTDSWAPFGGSDMAYRVAIRTQDGNVSWRDYPYQFGDSDLFKREIRIDFGDDYVELDNGIAISDAYKKSFESRRHLDGSEPGYWSNGTSRSGSASGVIVRVYDESTDRALRRLARYSGPVMVRMSDGVAYEANVDVSDIGISKGTAGQAVSLNISEVDASEYMATVEIVDDGQGE